MNATPTTPAPPPPKLAFTDTVVPGIERGVAHAARALGERRGLRTGLLGALLVTIALVLGMNSALTIPFVIAGFVLIAIGSLGPRLSGRMALEWGASGTVIEIRTEITPPGTVAAEHRRQLPLPATVEAERAAEAEVIEGSGDTIEIEVSELEALLDAAGTPAVERLDPAIRRSS